MSGPRPVGRPIGKPGEGAEPHSSGPRRRRVNAAEQPTRGWARQNAAPAPPLQRHSRIPKSQLWLFWIMLLLILAMSTFLLRLREQVRDHFAAATGPLPLEAAVAPVQPLRLYLANDADGSLAEKSIQFPLPADRNARARVVIEKLLEEYTAPGSSHPLTGSPASVEEVYLLPVPGARSGRGAAQLAVVNLTAAFVQNHPSGIEPETLTLLSIIATLRANLPEVAQVRFVVDGQTRSNLAGHADLTRTYLAAGTQMAAGSEPGQSAANAQGEAAAQREEKP